MARNWRNWFNVLVLIAVVGSGHGLAEEFWMPGDELKATFSGVTIDGQYADGRSFTERYGSDMALEYSEGPRETTGRWSVVAGTFCTIYTGDPSGGCFRVARIGPNCFEFYFVARTEDEVVRRKDGKPGWTARGWVKGQRATCQEEPIVYFKMRPNSQQAAWTTPPSMIWPLTTEGAARMS